ncbi:hypothetical protein X797_001632 [Metarhizium robertsii]|uniref:Uncharacterized protein n=2 Tax=Metarhizium robertsii TaxID=568076 RepID=E9F166_METRA|nr:uncharacterized protein MAA_06015 [Metarhizium robertsii ARSEF 23]EFY98876.1 hypothetical protein MAA_06015 [Metarhizium robertsii ARSEF 23]EXV03962.1 hypothetical protein X797_001632 [Metarhizium robertsii]
MDESNPRPGNDLESPTAQRRSSTPAVSPQHSTRVASWTQSERGLQQSLLNSAEKLARANMSAETLIQPENALPEGAVRAPGVRGQDVQLAALYSQISPETLPVLQAAAKMGTDTNRKISGGGSAMRTSEYIQRISSRDDASVASHQTKTPTKVSVYMGRDSIGCDDGYSLRLLDTPSDIEKDGTRDEDDGYSLRVLEIPLNGESPANCVVECHSEAQTGAVLAGLGPIGTKSARIYWSVLPRDGDGQGRRKLHGHIERMLGHEVSKAPHAPNHFTDFGAVNNPIRLRTQWNGAAQPYIVELFQVEKSQPEESFPYSPAYRLHKFQAQIQCIEFQEDKLVVLCQSYLQGPEGKHANLRAWNHFVSDMHWQRNPMLEFLDGSRPLFTKLLLLYFLNTGLDWSHHRIADIKSARRDRTDDDTELHKDAGFKFLKPVTEWQKIIMASSEALINICHDLANSADYMVRHLQWGASQASAGNAIEATPAWKCVALDIAVSCEEVRRQSTQIFACEQGRYELYKAQVDAKTSQNGTLVTILASTFLPASLAVGCLSMNTRFAKFGGMLFDLLGVIVLIGGFAVVSVAVIRIWIRARSHGPWKTKTQRARSVKSKARVWIIVSCLYLLVTASFLIIMLGNYLVGGVTLGVTAAVSLVGFALYLLR